MWHNAMQPSSGRHLNGQKSLRAVQCAIRATGLSVGPATRTTPGHSAVCLHNSNELPFVHDHTIIPGLVRHENIMLRCPHHLDPPQRLVPSPAQKPCTLGALAGCPR
jgi:hypothetical protein